MRAAIICAQNGHFETVSLYNALDQRIGVKDSGTQTWTVYNGESADADPYADCNGSGTLTERYLFGPGVINGAAVDEILARTSSGGTTAWYLTDKLGSVRDIVSTSGTELDHIVYDSFGNIVTETNATNGDRFKFAGMQFDAATGQYYDHARWYGPGAGRFIGQDPSGFTAGDADLYRYAGNGPSNAVDPTGLSFLSDYWHYLTNPTQMDPDLQDAQRDALKVAAVSITAAGIGSTVMVSALQAGLTVPQATVITNAVILTKLVAPVAFSTAAYVVGADPSRAFDIGNECADALTLSVLIGLDLIQQMPRTLAGTGNSPSGPGTPSKPARIMMMPDPPVSTSKAGRQGQPTGGPSTLDHYRFNGDTGQWERSTVTRDPYGRQTSRTDWTDHGRPDVHDDPHHHVIEWNNLYPNGLETGPITGPAPGHQ